MRLYCDAVLLLGPLYHLVEREDRLACLREAHRVCARRLAWGAAISYFASLFGFAVAWILRRPCFALIVARDLEEGQHRNSTGNPLYFTDASLHPDELLREFLSTGFQLLELVAIEGPGWLARDFDHSWMTCNSANAC